MKKTTITSSFYETRKLGEDIAQQILDSNPNNKKAKILALNGDLGSGKTTFVQGFAKGLGIDEKILSPTYIIFKKFKIKNLDFNLFYHIDCYRIQKEEDLLSLGFKEFSKNPKNIIAIEWASKIKKILPKETIFIDFKTKNKNKREIIIK